MGHQLPRQPPPTLGPLQRVEGLDERLVPVPVPAAERNEMCEAELNETGLGSRVCEVRWAPAAAVVPWGQRQGHGPLDGRLLELGGVDLKNAREDDVVDQQEGQDEEGGEDEDVVVAQAVVRLAGLGLGCVQ